MTRAPAASTRGGERAAKSLRQLDDGIVSVIYVVMFVAGLTAFLAAALAFPIHPLTAVLLALGAMAWLLQALAELLQVSQVRFEQPGWNRAETDPEGY